MFANILKMAAASAVLSISAPAFAADELQRDVNSGWDVTGFKDGARSDSLETDVIIASAYASNGAGIVFLCSEKTSLVSVIAYKPSNDLVKQASKSQSIYRTLRGDLEIDGESSNDNYILKNGPGTLQAKSRGTSFKLLNAAFSGKPAKLDMQTMKQLDLVFPTADENLKAFVEACPATRPAPKAT